MDAPIAHGGIFEVNKHVRNQPITWMLLSEGMLSYIFTIWMQGAAIDEYDRNIVNDV